MKKKVFSLMMMLLLAFMGVAKAEVVTIGDGTGTTYYAPFNSLWGYSFVEQVYTANEIGTAGTISAISFNMSSTDSQTNQVDVFMKNVTRTNFSGNTDWETVTANDMVFSGTVTFSNGWTTITLDTPFEYDGTSNLMIGMHEYTSGYSTRYFYYTSVTGGLISGHSDSVNPDPYNMGSFSGTTYVQNYRANIQITIAGEGGGSMEDMLHVKYMDGENEVIDTLNMGVRPAGAWMEPFNFTMYSEGPNYTVNVLDFTPSDGMFSVEGEELPFQVRNGQDVELTLTCNGTEAGVIERQFVAITEGNRAAHIWPVMVELYEPLTPDVWEKACTEATEFPFVEVPQPAHNVQLHNDYTLPFPEIPEGYDAVYKLVFENDMVLNAEVTQGENGKVALYTEDFYGEGGPMATNNYNGPLSGAGGAAATPFEAQIGEGTSTTGYFPFYTLYNYTISENLFLATELAEAGVTSAPMTSLSWYATNAPGYAQQGITIWMANVEDAALTTTSHIVTNMTKVYTGAMTPAIGWNEFVFNEGTFSWDGHSNVLIFCQRNNGSWNSTVNWQATTSLPFNAMAYRYQDSGAYDPTVANTMYTSTTRPNIIMKSARGSRADRDVVEIGDGTGTTYYFPIDNYFNYSCTEQIYTADEIGTAGTINSISFYYNYGTAYTANNVTMYMKNVERSSFTSTTDCEPLELGDIVWTGSIAPTAAGWYTFNLDTPFYYDGTSNLMVAFFDGTSGYPGTSYTWRQTTSPGSANMALRYYSDSSCPDPYNLATYGGSKATYTYRSNIQLDITAGGAAGEFSYGPVITDAPVAAGTYYLVASSTDADFEVTINAEEMPCPDVEAFADSFNPIPADDEDEIEPASVTLKWNNPANATEYQVVFGSTYYPQPGHPQTVISDWTPVNGATGSFTVRNLWNNTNYFWYVVFRNGGACEDGVEGPHWGFTTHLNIPQNLTAVDETVFDDEQIVLNWTAVVDRTYRMYNVYRDGELIGHTTVNNISNTTYTDGPLEYNMEGYTYYVTAVYDEGESAPSNTVNVKVSGYGDVNGHVYEQDGTTGIAGATVTMVGQDEFGVSHTYNFQTNAQGYYSGHIYAGAAYDGQAAKDGYQTATAPVQGEPIVIDYDETTSPIDYILDENFDPVCTVIAEYYPDSLDPNSPYVKVYWGCGLPGEEIVEDFETGDFSKFDWQVDPTYPWTVTTNNPYEGTYCMKSGGAGVANVVSNMTVTVNIPADGIMSFFGKISCESNWDYGYFYIDGVQKGSYTGAGSWGEKKFDITAGDHTFQWRYTKDGSVNSNDDCFYVDYITFYKRPEPAQPGWHTYCESEFNNAVGSNLTTTPSWAYEYPASFLHNTYAGWNITKVSLFSDNMYSAVGGNYTCRIYVGGNEPAAGTMVSTITVDVPSNQNAWVDWDLTTPVNVTGNDPIWVVWTANTTVSSWPAGCCGDLNDLGTWWDGGSGWEHLTYGTWTMRHWFTNRAGRSVAVGTADNVYTPIVDANPINSNLRTDFPKGGDTEKETVCANPNAVKGAALSNDVNRSLNHYRVYRTNCYQECPFTEENTVLLATVWVPDTVYIDVEWADLEPGVYKWGVGAVYEGNRGEMIEAPINWTEPQIVNNHVGLITRDFASDEATEENEVVVVNNDNAEVVMTNRDMNTRNILFNQAEYVTDPGAMANGADASWIKGSQSTWGPGAQQNLNHFVAEDFTLDAASTINEIEVYAYQTGSSTASTFTGLYAVIYDGNPMNGGNVIWGDYNTNIMTSTAFTNCYRGSDGQTTATTRPIMSLTASDLNISLAAGTYYLGWGMTGSLTSGPWAQPQAQPVIGNTGEAYQTLDGSSWSVLTDSGTSQPYGCAFMVSGTTNGGGGSGSNNCNELALPRESETIWSNCLDKDMYIIGESQDGVTVNVLLNSADSPEGVQVTFTNYNEAEQEMYPIEPIVLDETGFYAFDSFRRGNYKVNVTFDGYEPIEDSVSIWEPVDLRYVMIEIIYGVSDLYVSSTGWAMWDAEGMPTPGGGGGGGQGGNGDTFSLNFDDSQMPADWTVIDGGSPAGYGWKIGSTKLGSTGNGHNGSADLILSQSYDNSYGVVYPDNWFISPAVTLANGSQFSFWACGQDAGYAAEHCGVFVSTTGTNPSDFTMVQEWTLSAKSSGEKAAIRGDRAQGTWRQYTVDLSAYAGEGRHVAIRHFNCSDQFYLDVDDVELTNGAKSGDRHLEYFKVMCTSIDGEPIFNANSVHPFCQVATDQLVPGEHYIAKVAAMYSTGMSAWTECEWQYIPCETYAGTLNGVEVNGTEISWEYPGGGPVPPQPGQGDSFTVDFEAGMPAGWNVIDGNNDGWTWCMTSNIPSTWTYYAGMSLDWYHNGTNAICSGSYINGVGALNPDEYLVSPQVTLAAGSTFSFYAAATDASYAADHFGVFVSDNGTSDWTMVNEWTLTAKNGAKAGDLRASRDGNGNRLGNWYNFSVDLSNFAGQKYIAIRHFGCTDQYIMCVDDIELTSGAKSNRAAWDLMMTFNAAEAAHYGVAYDGTNFYTSNWGYSSATHNFYKYDLQGNMLEGFEIPGCGTLRGMTYDGEHFYGVANSSTVYCVDLANHSVINTFTSAYGAMRGITYDPVRDGFWVIGNWSGNLTLIDRSGAIVQVGPEPTSASDLAYYMDENDVEHVYCFNNGDNGVYDYNITTNTLGGSVFNFSAVPGFNAGSSGGCTVASFNNKIAFIGDIQQDPNLIGIYELRDDNVGPVPPVPAGDIIGAMIFVDGEWVAEVPYPTNTYTYEGEGEEVCVRMIYNGTNNLPEGNIYYSMSCPECEALEPGIATCEPGAPIHSELVDANHIKVWWGNAPAAPVSDWLYYDDGTNEDAIGLTNGGSFYWGIKFPAAAMSQYEGCSVTKIGYFDYSAHTGTVRIYNGSNGSAPGTLIGTYNYTANGTSDWVEWTIPAVAFDNTQDLWIVMNNASGQYVAALGPYTGDPNGTMISTDGSSWYTLEDATGGQLSGTWNLRCYVTNQAKGGEIVALDDELNGTPGGVIANAGVSKHGEAPAYMTRAELVKYNVYRSTEATGTYTLIGEVAATGADYYEYIDSPTHAGTYYYQVRALYDNDCESEPAQAADDPSVNYVSETTTADGVDENGSNVALYPNPTKGNVTIEAEGMSRITVVSVLGQVVFDTELDADTYTLNMSQFNAGMYMVRVYTEGGVTVKRVTVMQ